MSDRKLRSPYFWEEAPLLRPVLALIAGILLYAWLPPCPWSKLFLLVTPLLLAALAVAGLRRDPGRKGTMLQSLLAPLFFAALGLLASAARDTRLQPGFAAMPPAGPTVAVISGSSTLFESGESFPVIILLQGGGGKSLHTGARVVCYNDSSGTPKLLKGDTLLLRGTWESLRPAGNPGEPDLAAALRRKGICYRMQTAAARITLLGRPHPQSLGWLQRIHSACALRLQRHIHDAQALGLIRAMLLGDEAGFDPLLRGLYSDTGIIHIVSISGSHVAMLFAVIAALLQWIPGERGAWIRYGAGLLAVWLYVLIAGAPPSALRSAVMFSVVALSTLSKREGRGLNTLCTAAFILLLAEPVWLFAPGFQLSFAAVLSLLLFYTPLLQLLPVRRRPLRWLWQAVCASIAAEILTAPIVVAYFHNFPLMFIPANLIAGIAIGAGGLIGGMLVVLSSPVPPIADGIGILLSRMLDAANQGLTALQRFSPEAFRHLYLSTPAFLLLMTLISLAAIAWLRRSAGALLGGLCLAVALALLNLVNAAQQLRQHRLVVYSNGRQALIDEIRGMSHRPIVSAGSGFRAVPGRVALNAWRISEGTAGQACFAFGEKRVLILSDSLIRVPAGNMPVDVLILTQAMRRLRIGEAISCFRPRLIVLASRFSDRRRAMWADSCAKHRIRLHDVSNMGAWICRY